ncbi:VanZ family protein [Paenisporosarcina macmurdoensis]|uniref:VanZ family protein n=1 Tax=Paenisporosarcina macmurdoensis TaxID=212659 RepID=A0ABW1L161_9BACL
MKKYILFILILLVLFYSSAQTYEEQSMIPDLMMWLPGEPFKGFLSLFQIPYWGTIVSVEERGYHAFIEFLLRKGAHIAIFGALAFAAYIMFRRIRIAFILTVVLAIADEYHQSLTGGRTPTIHDVMLDSFGAALALTMIWIYKKYRQPITKRYN